MSATDHCCCTVAEPVLISARCCHCHRSEGTSGLEYLPPCLAHTPPDLCPHRNTQTHKLHRTGHFQNREKLLRKENEDVPTFGALSLKRPSYRLFANRNAPFSTASNSKDAERDWSMALISAQDTRASGPSRLSTVWTTAWERDRKCFLPAPHHYPFTCLSICLTWT